MLIDPPENTTISNTTIEIVEDNLIPKISCHGNGYPKLQYQWIRNGMVISDGSNLHLYSKMTRKDAGIYECVSRNKHGTQAVQMNVSISCKHWSKPDWRRVFGSHKKIQILFAFSFAQINQTVWFNGVQFTMKIHWFVWAMEIQDRYVLHTLLSIHSFADKYCCYFRWISNGRWKWKMKPKSIHWNRIKRTKKIRVYWE